MKQTFILSAAMVSCLLGLASTSNAQVFIRAPFVRVGVGPGGGVSVRAPFVNVFVPGNEPYYGPYYPQPIFGPYYPQPIVVGSPQAPAQPGQPATPSIPLPTPQPVPLPQIKDDDNAPPQPIQPAQPPTLEAFAKSFQPKAGSYEITLVNPVTNQPTNVRFSLPEGTPRRVQTRRDSIEFIYGLRQWVRIEFDKDGALVTSR